VFGRGVICNWCRGVYQFRQKLLKKKVFVETSGRHTASSPPCVARPQAVMNKLINLSNSITGDVSMFCSIPPGWHYLLVVCSTFEADVTCSFVMRFCTMSASSFKKLEGEMYITEKLKPRR